MHDMASNKSSYMHQLIKANKQQMLKIDKCFKCYLLLLIAYN